jgi:hypothetical protein
MTEIIAALQNEIAAAQKKRAPLSQQHWYGHHNGYLSEDGRAEYHRLGGYIQGLNQALYLLTREPVGELEH